jgi:hypothetical protein
VKPKNRTKNSDCFRTPRKTPNSTKAFSAQFSNIASSFSRYNALPVEEFMEHSLPRPRIAKQLPDSLQRRLNSYALAASATGVSLAALAQPAQGKIVYTPAHVKIGPKSQYPLDLNHDGTTDFTFTNGTYIGSYGTSFYFLSIMPAQGNQAWGHTNRGYGIASALFPKVRVGKNQHFSGGGRAMASMPFGSQNSCDGPWANVRSRYLGLKFLITGKTHYGWARLNVSCPYGAHTIDGTLTGYAYETVPNRPLLTGQEHGTDFALGRLALGSAAPPAARDADTLHNLQTSNAGGQTDAP